MTVSDEHLAEVRTVCPDATVRTDGPHLYIHFPKLSIPTRNGMVTREALLAIKAHTGYPTRLLLSEQVLGATLNWQPVQSIFGRQWYPWSWGNVPETLRPAEILAEHLRAFR